MTTALHVRRTSVGFTDRVLGGGPIHTNRGPL